MAQFTNIISCRRFKSALSCAVICALVLFCLLNQCTYFCTYALSTSSVSSSTGNSATATATSNDDAIISTSTATTNTNTINIGAEQNDNKERSLSSLTSPSSPSSSTSSSSSSSSSSYNTRVKPLKELNLRAFLGQWYEQAVGAIPKFTIEKGCTCTGSEFTLSDPMHRHLPLVVDIENTCFKESHYQVMTVMAAVSGKEVVSEDAIMISPAVMDIEIPRPNNSPNDLDTEEMIVILNEGREWLKSRGVPEESLPIYVPKFNPYDIDDGELQAIEYDIIYAEDTDNDGLYDLAVTSSIYPWMGMWFISRNRDITESDMEKMKQGALDAGVCPQLLTKYTLFKTEQSRCPEPYMFQQVKNKAQQLKQQLRGSVNYENNFNIDNINNNNNQISTTNLSSSSPSYAFFSTPKHNHKHHHNQHHKNEEHDDVQNQTEEQNNNNNNNKHHHHHHHHENNTSSSSSSSEKNVDTTNISEREEKVRDVEKKTIQEVEKDLKNGEKEDENDNGDNSPLLKNFNISHIIHGIVENFAHQNEEDMKHVTGSGQLLYI